MQRGDDFPFSSEFQHADLTATPGLEKAPLPREAPSCSKDRSPAPWGEPCRVDRVHPSNRLEWMAKVFVHYLKNLSEYTLIPYIGNRVGGAGGSSVPPALPVGAWQHSSEDGQATHHQGGISAAELCPFSLLFCIYWKFPIKFLFL